MIRGSPQYVRKKLRRPLASRQAQPEVNPFSKNCMKVSGLDIFVAGRLSKISSNQEVRIALVSLPEIPLHTRKHFTVSNKHRGIDEEACSRSLCLYPEDFTRRYLRSFKWCLSRALKDLKANIVCVNELGMPLMRGRPWSLAARYALSMAKRYNALVVAGSAHDHRTLYNTAHVFFPGSTSYGVLYHKQVSACRLEKLKELVSVPSRRAAKVTNAFGLNVALLVCLDLLDYSAAAAVVQARDRVDLLLVPCYSRWMSALERVAADMSRVLPGAVALVNCRIKEQVPSQLYRFGEPEQAKRVKTTHGDIALYKIDTAKFRDEKLDKLQEIPKRLSSLFGVE